MDNAIKNINDEKPRPSWTQIADLADAQKESRRVTLLRSRGLQHYYDTPVPDRVSHLWRYTDPREFFINASLIPDADTGPTSFTSDPDLHGITLIPGAPPMVHLDEEQERSGIEILPLALAEKGLDLLGSTVPFDHGIFEALNAAIWTSGVYIHIPAGIHLKNALRIKHIAISGVAATRVVISLQEGAEARIIEELVEGGPASSVYSVSEGILAQDARLDGVLIQRWNQGTVGHVTSRVRLGRDAHYRASIVTLGGSQYKADLGAILEERGSRSEIIGVSFGDKRQKFDHHVVHHHKGPHTLSNIAFKSAATGRASSAFTGLIRIEENAPYSEAYQENRNLLLSPKSRADTIPELEIMTNEVSCTHGATTAPIDPDQLFYLQSRGVPKDEAVKTIVRGFFDGVLRRVPWQLHDQVSEEIEGRLENL